MTQPWLSVVLPCRNQADHIGQILNSYLDALDVIGRPFELVVVPNACTDDTPAIVNELSRNDPRVRVLYNAEGGWGRSVRTGLAAARGEVLCYTNTARTDPARLPTFVQTFDANPHAVVKAQRVQRKHAYRELGSFLFNLESRLLFGIHAGDVNGTPKMFSRDVYRVLPLACDGDLLDLEFMAGVTGANIPVVDIPIPGFRRHGGKSTTTLKSAWRMYVGALALRRQSRAAA